jgi:hypothetical protein
MIWGQVAALNDLLARFWGEPLWWTLAALFTVAALIGWRLWAHEER